MKCNIIFLITLTTVFGACNNTPKLSPAKNALDAAREFELACLQNNFDKAKFYSVDNQEKLSIYFKPYTTQTDNEIAAHQQTSLVATLCKQQADGSFLVVIKNPYLQHNDSLVVIQQNQNWLVKL